MGNLAPWGVVCAVWLVGCGTSDNGPASSQAGAAGSSGGDANGAASNAGGSSTQAGSASAGSPSTGQGGTESSTMSGSNAGGSAGSGGVASCAVGTPLSSPAFTECPAASTPGPPATALAEVNALRAHMGLPCMTLVTEISAAAQKHCDYYQQNLSNKACIANAHEEVETCAGFVAKSFATRMTLAGYTGSPRSEVMAFSGEPAQAIAQWINSVYHRTPLLSPWLAEMGYGMTAECDTIDLGQGAKTPDSVTAVYPYPGQADVPLDFDGSHEGPTPPEPPSGWPSASPIHLYVRGYTVISHEVFVKGTCAPLPHQWLPEKDQYILYPDKPFAKLTEYRVLITGTKAGEPLSFDWSFTTEN